MHKSRTYNHHPVCTGRTIFKTKVNNKVRELVNTPTPRLLPRTCRTVPPLPRVSIAGLPPPALNYLTRVSTQAQAWAAAFKPPTTHLAGSPPLSWPPASRNGR